MQSHELIEKVKVIAHDIFIENWQIDAYHGFPQKIFKELGYLVKHIKSSHSDVVVENPIRESVDTFHFTNKASSFYVVITCNWVDVNDPKIYVSIEL